MKTANVLGIGVGFLLLVQVVGFTLILGRLSHQEEATSSLKIAFDTEIKAREELQTQVSALKPTVAPAEQPLSASVDAIFGTEPSNLTPDVEQKLDALKKQYEDVLVLQFFLAKCGKSTVQDYHTINSNLSQDMATLNAPGRLQYDIMTAAKGSYDAIYASSSCEGEQAEASEKAFRTYIEQLTKRSNVPTP